MKRLSLVILFTILPFAAHANNLVQNGSFEDALTIGGGLFDNIGCTNILTQCAIVPDWTASGDINALITNGVSAQSYLDGGAGILASNGSNFIGVDGSCCSLGPVSQMLTGLTVGDTYTLSFDQAAAQLAGNYGATTEQWIVSIGGSITGPGTVLLSDNVTPFNPAYYVTGFDDEWRSPVISNASGGFSGWQTVTESFVANSSNELLAFLGVGTPIGGPPMVLLDNVSVSSASSSPEPASLLLAAAGAALLAIVSRRRKTAR